MKPQPRYRRRALTAAMLIIGALVFSWAPATAGAHEHALAQQKPFTGRACVFNAPDAADGYGHAGWAVMDAGGNWFSGATEIKANEHKPEASWSRGPEPEMEMLRHFHTKRPVTPYVRFRCRDVANPNPGNAVARFAELAKQDYNLLSNNCLTRSMETIKAYSEDAMTGLPNTGLGNFPNGYFEASMEFAKWEPINWLAGTQ